MADPALPQPEPIPGRRRTPFNVRPILVRGWTGVGVATAVYLVVGMLLSWLPPVLALVGFFVAYASNIYVSYTLRPARAHLFGHSSAPAANLRLLSAINTMLFAVATLVIIVVCITALLNF